MSGRSEYREMTMTLVGPVDGYPVDKTDGYVYLFGEQDSKKVLSIPPGQVDFLQGFFTVFMILKTAFQNISKTLS